MPGPEAAAPLPPDRSPAGQDPGTGEAKASSQHPPRPPPSAGWPSRHLAFRPTCPGTQSVLGWAMVGGQPEAGSGQGIKVHGGQRLPPVAEVAVFRVGQVCAGAAGHGREEEFDHLAEPLVPAGRDAGRDVGLHDSRWRPCVLPGSPGPGAGAGMEGGPQGRVGRWHWAPGRGPGRGGTWQGLTWTCGSSSAPG